MGLWPILALAVVQGLTEFLPVSSSGHLRLVSALFGEQQAQTQLDVTLHLGTLVAVSWVYRRDLVAMLGSLGRAGTRVVRGRTAGLMADEPETRLASLILVGSVPAGAVGLLLGGVLEAHLSSPLTVGVMLLVTAALLVAGGRSPVGRGAEQGRPISALRCRDALVIGLAQSLALFRGISRSGATISAAMLIGVRRDDAARFSFLLSIPVIALSTALEAVRAGGAGPAPWMLAVGALVAAIVGWLALRLVIRVVRAGRLDHFAWYCAAVGIGVIAAVLLGGI